MTWGMHQPRRWFGEAAHLSDSELRDFELRALREDAARAASVREAAAKRRTPWWRRVWRAIRRMLGRER